MFEKWVRVRVPATSANLGPAFDCMGIALDLWNTVTVGGGPFKIEARGTDADLVPRNAVNLVVTGVQTAFKALGKRPPTLGYLCEQNIPIGRGLGSSSAAIVAGLLAGAALAGDKFEPARLVDLAADIEGHPDNVAAAILGGCVVGLRTASGWMAERITQPDGLTCVVFCPTTQTKTSSSRAKLPHSVPHADAVYNIGRAAMLTHALTTGRYDLLSHATEDRIHQPYRTLGMAGFKSIAKAAMDGGAHGVFLSGSGPSVVAFASARQVTISYEIREAARRANIEGRTMVLGVARGAYIEDQSL